MVALIYFQIPCQEYFEPSGPRGTDKLSCLILASPSPTLPPSLPHHRVDFHSSLQQSLDGAVVSVARSQVERSVPASVAGHEVGVSAHQHAHHLHGE